MTIPDALPDTSFHVIDRPRFRRLLGEQRTMDILGREPGRPPHDDVLSILVPLQDRARADAKPLTNTGGHRYLPLRRELRVSDCHA
jgi:hypothetical protein